MAKVNGSGVGVVSGTGAEAGGGVRSGSGSGSTGSGWGGGSSVFSGAVFFGVGEALEVGGGVWTGAGAGATGVVVHAPTKREAAMSMAAIAYVLSMMYPPIERNHSIHGFIQKVLSSRKGEIFWSQIVLYSFLFIP